MKSMYVKIAVSMLILGLLTACGGQPTESPASPPTETVAPATDTPTEAPTATEAPT